jgi:hypothetical protein
VVTLRAIAVRLDNVPGNPSAFEVYTPAKSKTGFILACALARTSLTQYLIW